MQIKMLNDKENSQVCQVLIDNDYYNKLQTKFNCINFRRTEKTNGKYITNVINKSISNDVRIFNETQIKRLIQTIFVPTLIKKKLSYFSQEEDKEEHKIYELNNIQDLQTNEKYAIHNIGHATLLIQISGFAILTDPVFNSLNKLFYPEKTKSHPDIKCLPIVDVILISHNHRDHVDQNSLTELLEYYKVKKWQQPNIFVPLGDKKLFEDFGFEKVFEFDWFVKICLSKYVDSIIKTVNFVNIPADHRSGRTSNDIHKSLVSGWIINPDVEDIIFKYSGDTRSLSKETQQSVDAVLWNEIKHKKINEDKIKSNIFIPDIIFLEPSGPNYTRCDMNITHQSTSYSALLKFIEAQNLSTISEINSEQFLNKIHTLMIHHNKYELGPDRFNEGLFIFKKLIIYLNLNENDLKNELLKQEEKLKNNEDRLKVKRSSSLLARPILLGLPSHSSLLVHAKDFIINEIIEIEKQLGSIDKKLIKEHLLKRTVFPKIGERLNKFKIQNSKFDLESVQKYKNSLKASLK